jgi:hypothetical protein
MGLTQLGLFLGWSALLSAVASLATLVTGVLFFAKGGPWGRINDSVSVLQMLLMLPLAGAMYLLNHPGPPLVALVAAAVGAVGMLVAATLQMLLVIRVLEFEQVFGRGLAAGAVIGLWLMVTNLLALLAASLPTVLALCGIAAGVAYVMLAVGFRKGGHTDPLVQLGTPLGVLGYTAWAVWLGLLMFGGLLAG